MMDHWLFASLLMVCLILSQPMAAKAQSPASPASQPAPACRISTIATEQTWVSPYWGHNTPKIVFDGSTYYTVAMRGPSPEQAEGIICKLEGGTWVQTATLPGIYQPPTLLLDSQRRLIVLFTRNLAPVAIWRAKQPGNASDFETLPSPPDMPNAYYIGAAIDGQTIHLAYVRAYLKAERPEQDYSMLYTRLDLDTLTWTSSTLMQAGQVNTKPKTAWTYPILQPTPEGLHIVASNSPDGGEGNTYNRVEYLFYPRGADQPTVREVVAQGQVGHVTYAYAMTAGPDGTVHVIHVWNLPAYGQPLEPGSPAPGVYHSWKPVGQTQWQHQSIDLDKTRFLTDGTNVFAVGMKDQALQTRQWQPRTQDWAPAVVVCPVEAMPTVPGAVDVLRASSGSNMTAGMAFVADGRLPADASGKQPDLTWAVLPQEGAP